MKKVRRTLLFSIYTIASLLTPPAAQAQVTKNWETLEGELDSGACVINDVATIQGTMCLLANVLSVSLTLIGLAGFVMMIIGSLTWLISGGNSQNVEKAKKTMTFAVVGLVVALSSYVIIRLIAEFTGISLIEQFRLPGSDTGVGSLDEWDNL